MHNIDSTSAEYDPFESDTFEFTEESEFAGDIETMSPFSEEEEMEMAADLLEVTDEAEFDRLFENTAGK